MADDRVAVVTNRNRRVHANAAGGFEFSVGARGAGRIRAHVQLQIEVGEVEVTDERVAVGANRNRRVVADNAVRFERAIDGGRKPCSCAQTNQAENRQNPPQPTPRTQSHHPFLAAR